MNDINKRIAEWMGFNWSEAFGVSFKKRHNSHIDNFTESLDSCALFEAELKRRQYHGVYAEHLEDVVDNLPENNEEYSEFALFTQVTATPTQRCEAWRRTVQGEQS